MMCNSPTHNLMCQLICSLAMQGRRYVGPQGRDAAASKIAATFKMYQERLKYLEYRRKKWAAGVIAISWVMHVKMSKVRKHLKATRMDQVEAFKRRTRVCHCYGAVDLESFILSH